MSIPFSEFKYTFTFLKSICDLSIDELSNYKINPIDLEPISKEMIKILFNISKLSLLQNEKQKKICSLISDMYNYYKMSIPFSEFKYTFTFLKSICDLNIDELSNYKINPIDLEPISKEMIKILFNISKLSLLQNEKQKKICSLISDMYNYNLIPGKFDKLPEGVLDDILDNIETDTDLWKSISTTNKKLKHKIEKDIDELLIKRICDRKYYIESEYDLCKKYITDLLKKLSVFQKFELLKIIDYKGLFFLRYKDGIPLPLYDQDTKFIDYLHKIGYIKYLSDLSVKEKKNINNVIKASRFYISYDLLDHVPPEFIDNKIIREIARKKFANNSGDLSLRRIENITDYMEEYMDKYFPFDIDLYISILKEGNFDPEFYWVQGKCEPFISDILWKIIAEKRIKNEDLYKAILENIDTGALIDYMNKVNDSIFDYPNLLLEAFESEEYLVEDTRKHFIVDDIIDYFPEELYKLRKQAEINIKDREIIVDDDRYDYDDYENVEYMYELKNLISGVIKEIPYFKKIKNLN